GRTFVTGGPLYAIDCAGRVTTLTEDAPIIEGGMAVAPRAFVPFGGRFFAPDETTGSIWTFASNGSGVEAPRPPFPAGHDVGVESLGFVPRLTKKGAAYVSDRGMQGEPNPGTDSILRLTAAQLRSAGVQAGDLLIAAEEGATTADMRCRKGQGCAAFS